MCPMEIRCSGCGEVALVRAEPVYEHFRRTGEVYVCTACGKRYATAEEMVLVGPPPKPQVFTDADREAALTMFDDDERQRCCGWCRHMILSPFGQRCGVTNRFTDATNLCESFEKKADGETG